MSWRATRFTQYNRQETNDILNHEIDRDYFDMVYGNDDHYEHYYEYDHCNSWCCKPTIEDIHRSFMAGLLTKLGIKSAEEWIGDYSR
jgi:hypothetical protein